MSSKYLSSYGLIIRVFKKIKYFSISKESNLCEDPKKLNIYNLVNLSKKKSLCVLDIRVCKLQKIKYLCIQILCTQIKYLDKISNNFFVSYSYITIEVCAKKNIPNYIYTYAIVIRFRAIHMSYLIRFLYHLIYSNMDTCNFR